MRATLLVLGLLMGGRFLVTPDPFSPGVTVYDEQRGDWTTLEYADPFRIAPDRERAIPLDQDRNDWDQQDRTIYDNGGDE